MPHLVSWPWRLLHWWWRGDRIRISPREGRLLWLEPGDILRIGGTFAQVTAREVTGAAVAMEVIYVCRTATESYALHVRPGLPNVRVVQRRGERERSLVEDEVEVTGL